ncbi:hypothetical protein EFL26_01060 [Nocardioides pocheonensis]|uniref:Uncharacterized protein n=1 Tax=Nocardioides pocheonensis TaxID=661485 RepID=A0A3N0GZ71_9ACTN|nr:hypothetical protein EFL26_01060 [Nocardioides pocheonensis]
MLGWISLSLLLLAAAAVVAPLVPYVLAARDNGVPLGEGPSEIVAPGDRTWGVYFDDRDNSGYGETCTVTDSTGRPIAVRDPGVTVSFSSTEMLGHVFDTPSDGRFTIACHGESADVRVGPVGSLPSLLVGMAAAALLGLVGVIAGSVWLTRRSAAPEAVVTHSSRVR